MLQVPLETELEASSFICVVIAKTEVIKVLPFNFYSEKSMLFYIIFLEYPVCLHTLYGEVHVTSRLMARPRIHHISF